MSRDDLRFAHPCNIVVSGRSGCGKTEFAFKLLSHLSEVFVQPPEEIHWYYGVWQPKYSTLPSSVKLIEGLPNLSDLRKSTEKSRLLILDDLMLESTGKDDFLTDLFIRGRHSNLSTCYLTHNIFEKNQRTARLNSSYLVLFACPADRLQISSLGRQLYPTQLRSFVDCFEDCTGGAPHGYLLIDLSPRVEDKYRLRTRIWPNETTLVYVIK